MLSIRGHAPTFDIRTNLEANKQAANQLVLSGITNTGLTAGTNSAGYFIHGNGFSIKGGDPNLNSLQGQAFDDGVYFLEDTFGVSPEKVEYIKNSILGSELGFLGIIARAGHARHAATNSPASKDACNAMDKALTVLSRRLNKDKGYGAEAGGYVCKSRHDRLCTARENAEETCLKAMRSSGEEACYGWINERYVIPATLQ
jgi:hypothetical protein